MPQKIQRQTLVDALALLRPGLSNKDIIESGRCFSFHGDRIVTYNDFLSVCVPLQTGIEGAIQAEEFYKLLDKIKADELELTLVENEVRIKAGKTRAGLRISSKLLPALEPQSDFQELPEGFLQALNFCQFSASRDMTKPHLTCIHIQGQFVTSSDNYRITETWTERPSPYDFLLPADAVQHLARYNPTHLALDPAWAHFLDEKTGVMFSCHLKAGEPMDVAKFFEVEGQVVTLPEELADALERTKIMVEGDSILDLKINLRLESGRLICRGDKNIGWVEEDLTIKYQGEPVSMMVNPLFLADILGRTREMMVTPQVCMFWGDNFRHLMLRVAE
jgi:DNA polymerase III sliding clamp (beta) subunit (PCNA family)